MATVTDQERILQLARKHGLIRAKDVTAIGLHTQILTRLVRKGQLERVARGYYRLPDYEYTEHHSLVIASVAAPSGVICLLSALQFHRIGTQLPHEVWMALDRRTRKPAIAYPPLRIVRFSGEALTAGVEEHTLEGYTVRVYNVAKTLADCFKYRNKIGLDVALEALNEAWRDRRFTMDEIERYARICRVSKVMRPYLEAIVA
jgi:predicted transcriptional regulator of viral defense system